MDRFSRKQSTIAAALATTLGVMAIACGGIQRDEVAVGAVTPALTGLVAASDLREAIAHNLIFIGLPVL